MIAFMVTTWVVVALAVGLTVRRLARTVTYRGRHRANELSTLDAAPILAGPDPLALFIDVLSMPVHGCDLPPAPGAESYDKLAELRRLRRIDAARRAMRRRSRLARAGAWPTGEFGLVAS